MNQPKNERETEENLIYAGFWVRAWASVVDSILAVIIIGPILLAVYGTEYFEDLLRAVADALRGEPTTVTSGVLDALMVMVAVAIVLLWIYRSATPGKSLVSARIVDARTGGPPTKRQCIVRYLGYLVSLLGLGLGFLWIAFDSRKQGWHDKIAGTLVVRPRKNGGKLARFSGKT